MEAWMYQDRTKLLMPLMKVSKYCYYMVYCVYFLANLSTTEGYDSLLTEPATQSHQDDVGNEGTIAYMSTCLPQFVHSTLRNGTCTLHTMVVCRSIA